MTLHPALPPALLLVVAAVLVAARAHSLSTLLGRTGAGQRKPAFRWSALTVAMLLLVGAAARPGLAMSAGQRPDGQESVAVAAARNVNVFFLVDRSVDSRVRDYGDGVSRMSGIRADMAAVIDAYPGARFAVIGFASAPGIDWPLSEDTWSLTSLVAGLSPYVSAPPDAASRVDAGAAANLLRYQLIQADQRYPDAQNLVFYLGEGAGGATTPQGSFAVGDRVDGGAVLGYGTTAGGPIPGAYVEGALTYLADTRSGAPVVSALNEPELRRIADELGVGYVHRDPGQPVSVVLPDVRAGPGSDAAVLTGTPVPQRTELYWVLALLAAALLLPEIYLLVGEFHRDRTSARRVAQP